MLGPAGPLLERARELAVLGEALGAVTSASGARVVVVGGEAGVGKTTLLRAFCDGIAGGARVLWGTCEPLFTPRPLGPFHDVADTAGAAPAAGERAGTLGGDAKPWEVAAALVRELGRKVPSVLVLEDLHWAD